MGDESCLQYLKRKVTDFFCCYDPSPKRQRLEETDQSGDMNSTEQNQPIDEESIPSIIVSDTPRLTTNQPTSTGEKEEERSGDDETNSSNFSVPTQLYLNFPFIEDSLSVNHVKNSLIMFVMRGLPGCGKSTIVKTLLEVFPKGRACSADDYFIEDGVYKFDRTKLKEAHAYSQNKAQDLCQKLTNPVIIDNTHVKRWEMGPYFKAAANHRYNVIIVEPKTPWKFDVDELEEKNKHNVDRIIIQARLNDWQDVQPMYYGWFLNPADTSALLEISDTWLKKCIAINEFFEDFSVHSNRYNMRSMQEYFTRDNMGRSKDVCHCTAKFIKKGDLFDCSEENEVIGQASVLHISGLVITPRTFGARVRLTSEQLAVYKQNDNEVELPFINAPKPNFQNKPKASAIYDNPFPAASVSEAKAACKATLKAGHGKSEHELNQLKGRRAHITLGCANDVRPVQTGLDQLAVLREQPITSIEIPGSILHGFGQGQWLLNFDQELEVMALFSGCY